MPFDFLEAVGKTLDILDLAIDAGTFLPSGDSKNDKSKKNKTKYLVEKTSMVFLILASVLLFIVLKDPLPSENSTQTMIVISLIGVAISFIFFFILYVLELFYFKSIWKLLFFSCSSIILSISVVTVVYFKLLG